VSSTVIIDDRPGPSANLIRVGPVLIDTGSGTAASIARLRPFVRPGGRLVVSTPNVANWAIRLSLLAGRWRYTDRGFLDRTHTHLFTRRTLVETIERAGYRVQRVDFSVPVPGDNDLLDLVGWSIGRLRPQLFAYQWIVTAQTSS